MGLLNNINEIGIGTQIGANLKQLDRDSLNITLDGHSFIEVKNSLSINIYQKLKPKYYYPTAIGGSDIQDSINRSVYLDGLVDSSKVNILVVYSGVNDVYNTSGSGTTAANLLATYISARNSAGWDEIYCYTMTPTGYGGRNESFESERNDFNTILKTIPNTTIIDLDLIGELSDYNDSAIYYDTLHPTFYCSSIMTDALISKIRQKYTITTDEFEVSPLSWTMTGRGDLSDTVELIFTAIEDTYITITGDGLFYSNEEATIGEDTVYQLPSQARTSVFVKNTGTTSLITFDNPHVIRNLESGAKGDNKPSPSATITDFKNISYCSFNVYNEFTGGIGDLANVYSFVLKNNQYIDYSNVVNCRIFAYVYFNLERTFTSAEVNNLLAAIWENKDVPRTSSQRVLYLYGNFDTGEPTGQGAVDALSLSEYRTPQNSASFSKWEVLTR